jgi:hypothetical protein
MKMLHYILFIINIREFESYFIKNQDKPICANCKYFIPNKNECSKFGDIDIITNEYTYEEAIIVRNDETKCREDALFFEKNNLKFITIPYYFLLKNNNIIIFLLTIFVLPYFIVFLVTL